MERRVWWKPYARCGAGEKSAIISKTYLSLSSGNPEPSQADIQFTERLIECGELLGIEVLDHIVVGNESFISLREYGVFN